MKRSKNKTNLLICLALMTAIAGCGSKKTTAPEVTETTTQETTTTAEEMTTVEETTALEETKATEETTAPEESETETVGFDSGSGTGTITDFFGKFSANISFTLPESGWKIKNQDGSARTLYLYNVKDPSNLFSGDPRLQFELKDSMEKVDQYKDKFENLQEIDPRTVGGIELKGRTYKYVGMEWTEYYGELPGGGWLSLLVSEISIEPGSEGDAILNSVTIE